KATLTHCKFFLWLDRHTEKLGNAGEHKDVEESEDVDAQFAMLGIENKITVLEERLAAMEKKNKPLCLLIMCVLVWVISLYVVVSVRD
ncbi:hypothetical protein PIB30_109578, partial [Stylosanthes scabra]|nr:hypothetical protein [Stylosanthes scabra]